MTSIADIKKIMTDDFISNDTVIQQYNLQPGLTFEDQFSVVSIESILFSIIATAMWIQRQLFTEHRKEVETYIAEKNTHTLRWYSNIARLFQYGHNLVPDSDQYDNSGLTDDEIERSRIIAHAAAEERDKHLVLKVAKNAGQDLEALSNAELVAFTEYMNRVKDAGVQIEFVSMEADKLNAEIDIYYNPLVLNADGQRLDGESLTPVEDAIRTYLKNLPFNGQFVEAFFVDALQAVDGVVIPHIVSLKYIYGGLDWTEVNAKYTPFAGYLRIADEDLKINYIPQSQII